ncbi:MAG: ABC transporter permease [Dehalococcoidia bacterium]
MAAATVDRKGLAASRVRRIASQLRRVPLVPMTIIIVIFLTAIFANFLTPHSETEPSLPTRLRPPFWMEGGSWTYPLGTDPLGRDLLTRIIFGARISLVVAFLTLFLGGAFGTAIGLISGYYGGRLDAVLMRGVDATMAFPIILFAILLVVTIGAGLMNVVVAIALILWARYARVIRGEVLSLKERDFIAQARIAGCSTFRIVLVHLFPNVLHTLIVMLTLQVGWVIIVEASLSFLGAGIPPPTPAWGYMVADGREYVTTAWWVSLFPGIAILLTVLSFNLFGDWLRDTLDPKLRQI